MRQAEKTDRKSLSVRPMTPLSSPPGKPLSRSKTASRLAQNAFPGLQAGQGVVEADGGRGRAAGEAAEAGQERSVDEARALRSMAHGR